MSGHIFLLVLFHSLHVLPWLDHFILLRSWIIHHVRLELLVLLTFLDHLTAPWCFLAFLKKSHVQLKKDVSLFKYLPRSWHFRIRYVGSR